MKVFTRCCKCNTPKPQEEFPPYLWKSRSYVCIPCHREKQRSYKLNAEGKKLGQEDVKKRPCLVCGKLFKTSRCIRTCPRCKNSKQGLKEEPVW